jgi:hypothetical protein
MWCERRDEVGGMKYETEERREEKGKGEWQMNDGTMNNR